MKTKLSFIVLLLAIACISIAQIPQKFKYQAVVRDSQHALLANQDVGFRMSILQGTGEGVEVYIETHLVATNPYGVADMMIGEGDVVMGTFHDINWGSDNYFLKVEVDATGGTLFEYLGTSQLISVPYALYSGNIASPTRKFSIQEEAGHPIDSALFEVRNAEGQTVFAVYPEGTRVYILDEQIKGIKGGFVVGGYSRTTKGITQEYMQITPDSIRLYIDEGVAKGIKGGFAVGGYNRTNKGAVDHYLTIKPDSANFLMVSDQPDESSTNALTVATKTRNGGDASKTASLFNLSLENYFIGHRAGSSNTVGNQNCFFGFESGVDNTEGYGNVFVGANAGRNSTGNSNTFIGKDAGLVNQGFGNSFIGVGAGHTSRMGSQNIFIGESAGAFNNGSGNVFIGNTAGVDQKGSNTLIIENSVVDSTGSLIWGRFDTDQLRLNARVGINRTAMEFALEVEGDVAKSIAGDWLVNSDARIKRDVMDIENACEQIIGLHPVQFRYTDEWMSRNPVIADKVYYNFIAQEFQEVFPDAVRRSKESLEEESDALLQMDSYPAQVVAIKAIQELIQENRSQQKMIKQLVEKVSALEEALER